MQSIFLRYPGGKAKAVTFSYDDNCESDKRLAELFYKYGLKGTFNFNGLSVRYKNPKYTDEEIQDIFLSKGHEIAVHGELHRPSGNLRPIEGIRDVLNCRIELEKRCGRIIRGMAYPDTGIRLMSVHTDYPSIKNYLTELDIVYARTLGGDNDDFLLPNDFHAWMPSAHHDNPKIMEYIDKFLGMDLSPRVYHSMRSPRLLYIWGHSFEFDRKDNWDHIEQICRRLSGNDEIWYATNIEIYDYVEAFKRLVWSADNSIVYNPTLKTVWLDIDGKEYVIKPDETLYI